MTAIDRDQLAHDNFDLIGIVVSQTLSYWQGRDRGDIEQAAFDGYGQAIMSFDPDKKVRFRTFASYRIRGAILDYLRSERAWSKRIDQCMDWEAQQQHKEFWRRGEYCLDTAAFRRGMLAGGFIG